MQISFIRGFFLFILFSASQTIAQVPHFAKYYDDEYFTLITGGAKNSSGLLMVISNDAVACINEHGTPRWIKRPWTDPLIVLKAIQAHEHNFVITAYDFNSSTIRFLIVDVEGNMFERGATVDVASFGEHTFIGKDSIIVTGRRPGQAGDYVGFVDLFDTKSGKRLWSYTSSLEATSFNGGKRIGSEALAIFGMQSGLPSKACLTILGTGGEEKWSRTFPATVNASIRDVESISGGRLAALLWRGESSDLLTLNSSGDLTGKVELPHATAQKLTRVGSTDELIIVGTSRNRIFLTAVATARQFVWWRYYGSDAATGQTEQVRGLISDGPSITFFGGSRWDSQSRAFLIQTNELGLLDDALSIDVKAPSKWIPSRGTGAKILAADFINDNELVAGGQMSIHPAHNEPVVSGFFARLNSSGDTLGTRTLLSTDAWGRYVNNAVIGVKSTTPKNTFIHEDGGAYGVYSWAENTLSSPIRIFTGKRSDFSVLDNGRLLFCFHEFDLQPYNEVGRLMIVDPVTQSQMLLQVRMVGSMIHKIIPSGRGTYFIAGEQGETYKIARKAFLAEINSEGVVLNSYTYDLGYKTTVNAIQMKNNGNLIIGGAVETESANKDLLLAEIDQAGTLIWYKTFDILMRDEVTTIELVPGGYLIGATVGRPVFGFQESFGMIAIVDDDKKITWNQFIGDRGRHAEIIRLRFRSTSEIIAIGNCEKWIPGTASFSGSAFVHKLSLDEEVVHVERIPQAEPQAYPNPFAQHLSIECVPGSSIELLNMHSQPIIQIQSIDIKTILDTSTIPDGIYILKIRTGNNQSSRRVVRMTSSSHSDL